MDTRVVLVLVAFVLLFGCFDCSHFRGGIITYKPSKTSPNTMDFSMRLAYRRSKVFCDNTRIANQQLLSTYYESWQLKRYRSWYGTSSSSAALSIYCSRFNADEDWIEGYRNFTFSGSQDDLYWDVRVYGGAWIGAITRHSSSSVNLLTRFNNTAGFNNSSPVSNIPLTVYVAKGIPSTITIPVHDPDGDIVRCRNASNQECYQGVCTNWPYGGINEENCSISYNGGGSVGQLYPIYLKLEDYANHISPFESSKSLGSVGLQFIIHIKTAVRLQGHSSGRLEVFHNGAWGTVCDDGWSMTDSHVACRQLGFESALSFTNRDSGATGQIWLDRVRCNGNETSIQQCRHRGWGVHSCKHDEDVHLNCITNGCKNYTVLDSYNRSQAHTTFLGLCDYYDITDGLWYRFMGGAGTAIATSCVPMSRCGTHASGWMNGYHPTQAEGIVTRTVCYHWYSQCCNWKNNINVMNCGGFYVYQLMKPQNCYYRYCGNGTALNATSISPTPSSTFAAIATSTAVMGHCASSPCRNGGTCRDTHYGYYCSCPHRYTGQQCETNYGCVISGYPCLNGGTCYGSYCGCPDGYTGRQCETNLKLSITCEDHYMEINLTRSYFKNVDPRNLHLKTTSCRVLTVTPYTITLRTPLDGCGTTYKENNETIVFENEVSDDQRYKSGNLNMITRVHLIALSFHCKYSRRKLVSTSFSPSKKIIYASEGSFGNFTFTMDLYKTSSYRTPYSQLDYPVPVSLNTPLWVQFEVKNTIADLVVFADSCRATTSTDPNSLPQYRFLEKGCVFDSTMAYKYNSGSSVQQFSINSFRFVYSNNQLVYLHCELMVCHRNSANSRCSSGCISSRRRREASEYKDSSKKYDLNIGPFKKESQASKNAEQVNDATIGTSAGLGAVGGLLLIVCGVLLFKKLRKVCFPSFLKRAYVTPSPPVPMEVTANSYEQNGVDLDEKPAEIEI